MTGLVLIALIGEAWLRLTMPFVGTHFPKQFVPNVGVLGKPNMKVRRTNNRDFWTISLTNSLGFLDREPISSERVAQSCHITMIGDSFVQGREVAIPDKFHVQLEEMATWELPHLDVTTSAFGQAATGQINQLPFYDEYARRQHPKIVILVTVSNDFKDNLTIFDIVERGFHPERMPFVYAVKDENGKIKLHPPSPDYLTFRLVQGFGISGSLARVLKKTGEKILGSSFLLDMVGRELKAKLDASLKADRRRRREVWASRIETAGKTKYFEKDRYDFSQEALDMMAFALDQFEERAERDGFSLIILSTHTMGTRGSFLFDRMRTLAHARKIPIIDQYDYIIRRGGKVQDAHWVHDWHWNPIGHQWAAEALLEYLKQNQELCDSGRREGAVADEKKHNSNMTREETWVK